jgi:hypothetical protein
LLRIAAGAHDAALVFVGLAINYPDDCGAVAIDSKGCSV